MGMNLPFNQWILNLQTDSDREQVEGLKFSVVVVAASLLIASS